MTTPNLAAAGSVGAGSLSIERGRLRVVRKTPYALLLGSFALALIYIDAIELWHSSFGWDFRAFYDGGTAYRHFQSPYVSGSLAELTSRQNFVYPLPTAAVFAPLSLLPYNLAAGLFVVANAVLLIAAVYLLGVRDIRCYAAILIGAPAVDGLDLGTISPILVFLIAFMWRYRDRTWFTATALSLLVLTKLFLWPLGVWLLATRRFKSVALASFASAVAVAVAAVPIGFGALVHYPSLLQRISNFEGPGSASLVGLGTALTGSTSIGVVLSLAGGGAVLLASVVVGRRGSDCHAFRLAVLASLALTPIVWNHYLLLLYVPLALIKPRFSPIWLGTAWVLGAVGNTIEGAALAVSVATIWAVALMQAGAFRRDGDQGDSGRVIFVRRVPAVVAGLSLWASLMWVLFALLDVVPAVASLRPAERSSHGSGTALVRLHRTGERICFSILLEHTTVPADAEVVEEPSGSVLVEHRMNSERLNACSRYSRTNEPRSVAGAFADRHLRLSLRVVSRSGRVVLAGPVVPPADVGRDERSH